VPAPVAAPVAVRAARLDAHDPACIPEYPAAAQRAGTTGITRVRMQVDAAGKVISAEVIGSSGPSRENRLLDNAAKAAFSTCRVVPGIDASGRPVGNTFTTEYVWKLE
jgi:TonB family protein